MLDIPFLETTMGKKTANFVQINKWVGVCSVVFKAIHRKILGEVAEAAGSVINESADFPDLVSDVSIVEYESYEEDPPRDLRDVTSKNDIDSSAV